MNIQNPDSTKEEKSHPALQEQKLLLRPKGSSKRASKFIRPDTACPLILQQRDKEILEAVHQHRFLTSGQLRRMFFGCSTRADARLRKLWENGFLERHQLRPLVFYGPPEIIYSLGKAGVDIVAQTLEIDRAIIARSIGRNDTLNPLFVEHLTEVNNFSLNFISLVEEHPELRLERWLNERDAQDEYQSYQNGRAIVRRLRPDGYGRYWYKNKFYSFFFELDRATETNTKFEEKAKSYLEYQRSGKL